MTDWEAVDDEGTEMVLLRSPAGSEWSLIQDLLTPEEARVLATALVRAAAAAGETPWEGDVDASPADLIRAAWEQLRPHEEDEWVAAAMGDLTFAYERLTGSSP